MIERTCRICGYRFLLEHSRRWQCEQCRWLDVQCSSCGQAIRRERQLLARHDYAYCSIRCRQRKGRHYPVGPAILRPVAIATGDAWVSVPAAARQLGITEGEVYTLALIENRLRWDKLGPPSAEGLPTVRIGLSRGAGGRWEVPGRPLAYSGIAAP